MLKPASKAPGLTRSAELAPRPKTSQLTRFAEAGLAQRTIADKRLRENHSARTVAPAEARVAVLVDCDNTSPEVLEFALRVVAQFGRVVLRRGYGNHATLANRWQEALVRLAFTPCLQYQYASGKNTSNIALALDAVEALFDDRADTFCLVTSDSDFAYLCRKLRERGATVHIVGEAKTPDALRNASDQFFQWIKPEAGEQSVGICLLNCHLLSSHVTWRTTTLPCLQRGKRLIRSHQRVPGTPRRLEASPSCSAWHGLVTSAAQRASPIQLPRPSWPSMWQTAGVNLWLTIGSHALAQAIPDFFVMRAGQPASRRCTCCTTERSRWLRAIGTC
jgi:uncharacterized protein (TIGR00288 family)